MGKVLIKWTRGLQTIQQVIAHVKYVGFRSKELDEKGFFDVENDKANYKEFIKRINDNPALKHPKSIKVQKLVFSLREGDYEAFLSSGLDYKHLIRCTLSEYEKRHGLKLDWIANIHDAKGHPHCHVVIKGVSDNKDANGRYTRVKFTKDDFRELKEIFDKVYEKEVPRHYFQEHEIDRVLRDITRGFEAVSRGIAQVAEKEQHKAEMERYAAAKRAANMYSREREENDRDR